MEEFLKTEKIYTISELNNAIKQIINYEFPDYLWVCGEVQDLRIRENKKHIYFNLVQKHPEVDEVLAKAKAIIFETTKPYLETRLKDKSLSSFLKNGIELKVLVRVNFYPKWGEYRLEVFDFDPVYTLGKIAQNRERVLAELKREGLLNRNKELTVPLVPLKIGLITAYNSAAYHDFLSELKKSRFSFQVYFFDSHMQGKFVERDLIRALNFFNSLGKGELDLIVITRGGGETSDLAYFDLKSIAKEVAHSKHPVISAIGHEINVSILELTSHSFFKTPTKVAQFIIERVREFIQNLEDIQSLVTERGKIILERNKKDLQLKTSKFFNLVQSYFSKENSKLIEVKSLLYSKTLERLKSFSLNLENFFEDMSRRVESNLKGKKESLTHQEEKLRLLNPRNILKRGFSITLKDNKVLKDCKYLKKGQILKTILYKGKIISQIESLRRENEEGD